MQSMALVILEKRYWVLGKTFLFVKSTNLIVFIFLVLKFEAKIDFVHIICHKYVIVIMSSTNDNTYNIMVLCL